MTKFLLSAADRAAIAELIRKDTAKPFNDAKTENRRRWLPFSGLVGKVDSNGITAASGATPGSGTVVIQNVDSSGDLIDVLDAAGDPMEQEVKNLHHSVCADAYIFCDPDRFGTYWVAERKGVKLWRIDLTEDMDYTTTGEAAGTLKELDGSSPVTGQTALDTCNIFSDVTSGSCGVVVESDCGDYWTIQASCP